MTIRLITLFTLLYVICSLSAGEQTTSEPPVLEQSEPWLTPTVNLRARFETADQDGKDRAHAETLRARLGLLSKKIYGTQFFVEYEGTLAADRDSYQAASVHGLGQNKSIIADPESHELNQLWISNDLFGHGDLKAGRQTIILDNWRYIGDVGWRQNNQTFDSATFSFHPAKDLTVQYGYIDRANRIFGSGDIHLPAQTDFEGNSHLVHTTYVGLPFGTLKAFAYFLDLTNDAGSAASNNSFGTSLEGKLPFSTDSLTFGYYGEYGYQTDAFDNPNDYGAHYAHATLSAKSDPHILLAGYERLGSDNGVGYQFPLSTAHKFNGFADNFLQTPGDGLQDAYIMAGTKLPADIALKAFYHQFYNAAGGDHFGNEVDLVLAKDLGKGFSVLTKWAHFISKDSDYADTDRFSLELNYKF